MNIEEIEMILKKWHCGCHIQANDNVCIDPREITSKLIEIAKAAKELIATKSFGDKFDKLEKTIETLEKE